MFISMEQNNFVFMKTQFMGSPCLETKVYCLYMWAIQWVQDQHPTVSSISD